jgi:hypothetical protein
MKRPKNFAQAIERQNALRGAPVANPGRADRELLALLLAEGLRRRRYRERYSRGR